MPPPKTAQQLKEILADASKTRLAGNEHFKKGEYKEAMGQYYKVILNLKGLDGREQLFPMNSAGTSKDGEKEIEDSKTIHQEIKEALTLVHLNMAAVHVTQKSWKRALQCAQAAQASLNTSPAGGAADNEKPDPTKVLSPSMSKAKFREAQARIGMGEISSGKRILEGLNKTNPDAAIVRELEKLKIEDKKGDEKKAAAFRGMYSRKTDDKKPAATPAQATKPIGAKIEEVKE
ncbi:hypothetical protein T439DRAFT_330197 [Meredithblackwellia eburnea MCA 4105]